MELELEAETCDHWHVSYVCKRGTNLWFYGSKTFLSHLTENIGWLDDSFCLLKQKSDKQTIVLKNQHETSKCKINTK